MNIDGRYVSIFLVLFYWDIQQKKAASVNTIFGEVWQGMPLTV